MNAESATGFRSRPSNETPWLSEEIEMHYGEPVDAARWRELLEGVAETTFDVSPEDLADMIWRQYRSQVNTGNEATALQEDFLLKPPRTTEEWQDRVQLLGLLRNKLQAA